MYKLLRHAPIIIVLLLAIHNLSQAQDVTPSFILVSLNETDGLTFYSGDEESNLTELVSLSRQFSLVEQNLSTLYTIPRNTQIAVAANRQHIAMVASTTSNAYFALVEAYTGQLQIVELPTVKFAPLWSPDSSKVALVPTIVSSSALSDGESGLPDIPGQIFIYDVETGTLQEVLRLNDAVPFQVTWSHDGSHLVYVRGGSIYSFAADGSAQSVIVASASVGSVCNINQPMNGLEWFYSSPCDGEQETLAIYSTDEQGNGRLIADLTGSLPENATSPYVHGIHPTDAGLFVTMDYLLSEAHWRLIRIDNAGTSSVLADYPKPLGFVDSVISIEYGMIALTGPYSTMILDLTSGEVIAEVSETTNICNLQWISNTQIVYGLQQPECNGVASETLGVRHFDIATGRQENVTAGLETSDTDSIELLLPP